VSITAPALILPALLALGACSVVAGLDELTLAGGNAALSAPCALPDQCASGRCVDGVCCESECSAVCESCNIPGLQGSCAPVPAGGTDTTCDGTMACDGSSGCATANGQPCGDRESRCASGFCTDGVCCESDCAESCEGCNVDGSAGACTIVPLGDTDEQCAGPMYACDGALGCGLANGQECIDSTQCASGACTGAPGAKVCTDP
jgi:hypothetical protein